MTSSDTNSAEPQAAPAKAPLKARLLMWLIYGGAGIFAVLVLLMVVGIVMQIGELPGCDSKNARDTMSNVFQEQKLSLTKYNEIKTVSSSKDEVVCQASLAIKGGGTLIADYTFYWDDSKPKVRYSLSRI
jgi:hypothetical protein